MKRRAWVLGVVLTFVSQPLVVEATQTAVARPVVSCGSQVLQRAFEVLGLRGPSAGGEGACTCAHPGGASAGNELSGGDSAGS